MKIAVAQTRPVKGDIPRNLAQHTKLITLAVSNGAGMIVFPELSLTGYEPRLAKELATDQDDKRLDDLQQLSDHNNIIIGAGLPTRSDRGPFISMIIFQPQQPRQTYSKQYLHSDEYPYFISGEQPGFITHANKKIAIAICYELSVPAHSENAHANKADIYIASVAKTVEGAEKANKSLSEIAGKYAMTVLMANSVGSSDNFYSAGKSAIWNNKGSLLAELNDIDEGLLIIDTEKQEITAVARLA